MKKKIIITGGLGFIGTKLIEKLKRDFEIIVLDNAAAKKKNKSFRTIKCDLTNFKKLKKIKLKNIDTVIHLAGQSSGPLSYFIPEKDLKLNLMSTVNIVNFAKKINVKKIIFSSTFTVYGDHKKEKLSENFSCNPKSFYAISKFASEKYLMGLCEKYKIRWNIVRLFNVYGPGQDLSRKDQGIVSIFLDLIRNNDKIVVKGSLKRFRDLVYIDDVINSLILLLKNQKYSNQIYNVGTGKKTTIKELIFHLSTIFKKEKKLKIKVSGSTHGDMLGCYANVNKINKHLNFKPKVQLKRGLQLFVNWSEENFYKK